MSAVTVPFWFTGLGVGDMGNIDLRFYVSILLRKLPYVVSITCVMVFAALVATFFISPKYSSSAKILAEAPQIPTELARSTVALSAVEQLQILQQQITARDDVIALAKRLNVYGDATEKPSDEDTVRDMRSRIKFEQLQLEIQSSGQGATVFNVSFVAERPDMAAKVANELAALILDKNQRQRTDRAGSTLQFFNQKVAKLASDLNKIEAEILVFKTRNKDTLPENLDFRRSQQGGLQDRLISLQREEFDLHTKRGNLIATYTNPGQLVGAAPLSAEQQILADLNRALAEQLSIFSETSPNIAALRGRIAALQSRLIGSSPLDTETEKSANSARVAPFGLDLQLSDIDGRLTSIEKEKVSVTQHIEDLSRSITGTPASETALNSLERNRQNIQMQYNAAIAQRAEALTGEQIEMRSDGGRFSLLEAATPPVGAVGLRRSRIVALGGLAGLGLGLALVVLLELLNKTIRRPAELAQLLQMQPLATIPNIGVAEKTPFARFPYRKAAAMLVVGLTPASLLLANSDLTPLHVLVQWAGAGTVG